jgi:hypothetical protein
MLSLAAAIILAITPPIPFSGESLESLVLETVLFPGSGTVAVNGRIGRNPISGTCLVKGVVTCDLRFQNYFVFIQTNEDLEGTIAVCDSGKGECILTRDVRRGK